MSNIAPPNNNESRFNQAPSQLLIAWGLTKYALKATLRNRSSLVFSLIFPLVFVAIFGSIGNGGGKISLGVLDSLNKNQPIYAAIQTIASQSNAPVKIVSDSEANLKTQLNQSKIGAILEPGASATSLKVVTSTANPQGGASAQTFLNGILSQLNLRAAGVTKPTFTVINQDVAGRQYRYIDFALPGQIGFSLISIATFGIAFPLITLRKTLVLKRIFATAAKPITFVVSQCLARSVQAMLQAAVILGVGIWGFHFTLAHGWVTGVELFVLSFLAVLAFLGFGILIGNIARDEQSLPIAINLFNLPQILLAGVFFPIDTLPHWVQVIGNNLPLAYLTTALRKVANDGASLVTVWPYILGIVAWGVAAYLIASRIFKSE
ncbi:MAG TPA: ABC transporter permease [Candidatus Saccharimonadales bacterium]|nr:ABC transporter permease [Candidatus Saccharimonadales bacterium]